MDKSSHAPPKQSSSHQHNQPMVNGKEYKSKCAQEMLNAMTSTAKYGEICRQLDISYESMKDICLMIPTLVYSLF